MTCPGCGAEQFCPCSNCAKMNEGKVVWVWDSTGEIISCGHCGYTMHADGWMDASYKSLRDRRNERKGQGNV